MILRQLKSRLGLARNKVFAVGFNKSATTSLHTLFESLGLASYHGVEWSSCHRMALLHSYDCFSDGPPADLAKLDASFPGAKFILQVRDLESWLYSRLAHIQRLRQLNAHRATRWWDDTEYAVKFWIKQRNEFHLHVLSYFSGRPADLLVVNFVRDERAADKVCSFLGFENPIGRPRTNVNPRPVRPSEYVDMVEAAVAELKVSEEDLRADIYCASLLSRDEKVEFPADSSLLPDSGMFAGHEVE